MREKWCVNDRIVAWIFLIIFIMDLFAIWFTMFMANIPTFVQWFLVFIFILVMIGTIVLVHHHNHKD